MCIQECNPPFAPICLLLCSGESAVHFSANVAKINRQNKIQERIMLITGKYDVNEPIKLI